MNKMCIKCGRKMKQQFMGLQHCKCGLSWMNATGYFQRENNMIFILENFKQGNKIKKRPAIKCTDDKKSD